MSAFFFAESIWQKNYLIYHKKLTELQQTNNISLTAKKGKLSDLCSVINWLFIILVRLVSKKLSMSLDVGIFFYSIEPINDKTSLLKTIGCSTLTT